LITASSDVQKPNATNRQDSQVKNESVRTQFESADARLNSPPPKSAHHLLYLLIRANGMAPTGKPLAQSGRPGRNRTCNPRIRNPMLYPLELRAQSRLIACVYAALRVCDLLARFFLSLADPLFWSDFIAASTRESKRRMYESRVTITLLWRRTWLTSKSSAPRSNSSLARPRRKACVPRYSPPTALNALER
jgi:hypothetical protein